MTDNETPDETTEDTDTSETRNGEPADSDDGNDESVITDADEDTILYKRADLEKLRQENGKYRQRAQRGEEYAQRLHTELVRATGKLADPTDLPFDEAHLVESDTLSRAIDDLLTRKPHLASRRPVGEIGQGPSPSAGSVDLAAILRGKA